MRNSRGEAPIHLCVRYFRRGEHLELLLARGADLDARDAKGSTPLMLAVANRCLSAVLALLAAGADPNCADTAGSTALHLAAAERSLELARVLLQAGADHTARDRKGQLPIDVARDPDNWRAVNDGLVNYLASPSGGLRKIP